jgi:hypothetical protein
VIGATSGNPQLTLLAVLEPEGGHLHHAEARVEVVILGHPDSIK